MNIVPVGLSADGERLEHGGFSLPLPAKWRRAAAAHRGKPLALGIRPEDICKAGTQDWRAAAEFDGVIEIFEPLGHEIIVHVRSGEDRILAKLETDVLPVMGQKIRLALNGEKIHLFDPQTEQRLAG
jgi:multiple sugar transport system ATP-binding protein